MEIVRKKLTPDELSRPGVRYNPECDCVQTTYDGGATWVDTPGADPRTAPQYQAPGISTSDPACDGAERITAALKRSIDQAIEAANAVQLGSLLLDIFLFIVPVIGIIAEAIYLAAQALLAIGSTAIDAAFTDDVYSQIKCIARSHLGADGQFTTEAWEAFQAECFDHFGAGTVSDVLQVNFDTLGIVGFNNAVSLGTETGDCSACDQWCHVIDFTLSDGGFSSDTTNGTGANYVPGVGWTENAISGNSGTYIIRGGLAAVEWTSIEFVYDASGAVTSGVEFGVLATVFQFVQVDPANDGTDLTSFWNGSATMDTVGLQLGNQSGGGPTGTSTIKRVTMRGPGADNNPFGSNNCEE